MANTIDEVITELDTIIKDSIETNNRAGYFAALYYKVTAAVKEGIEKGDFENGPRMEQLDVLFANRYLEAFKLWKNKGQITESWRTAFETTQKSSALVLQQLLLGMNAHINLDLGIAACEVAKGQDLDLLHRDFNAINTVISSLTYAVINDITRVSPLLSLLGLHATNTSILIQFSIGNARDGAWCFAEELNTKQGAAYTEFISQRDKTIARLAQGLTESKGLMRFTTWLIHLFEWKKPAKIIKALSDYKKEYITLNKPYPAGLSGN